MSKNFNSINFDDYFTRAMVFVGLVILVISVQIPISIIASHKLSNGLNYFLSLIYILGFTLAAWIAYLAVKRFSAYKPKRLTKNDLKITLTAWVAFFAIEVVLSRLNVAIFHTQSTANNKIIEGLITKSPLTMILMLTTGVFFSPVLEELTFRGFLIGAFFKPAQRTLPILVSGLLFAFPHMEDLNPISFLTYFLMGMILSYVYLREHNVYASISLHFLNNLIAMGALVATVSAGH